jgi:hypothetical protein
LGVRPVWLRSSVIVAAVRSFVLVYFDLTKRAKAGINCLPFGIVGSARSAAAL